MSGYDDRCPRQSEPNEYRGVPISELPDKPQMVRSSVTRELSEMLAITNSIETCMYLVNSAICQILDWDKVPK